MTTVAQAAPPPSAVTSGDPVALRARGIEIRKLVLLDAYPAELWKDLPNPTEVEQLEGMLTMAGVDRSDVTTGADGELTRDIVLEAIHARGGAFGSLPETALSAVIDMVGHNARIMKDHDTRNYDGEVHFFKAGLNPETMDEGTWGPFVTDMDVTELPVTHPGLVAPASLERLAKVLAEKKWPATVGRPATWETCASTFAGGVPSRAH